MANRILVVEDDTAISELICMNLEVTGYEVVPVLDGNEVEGTLEKEEDFDLALLDIMLPKLTGLEVCQQIREFSDVPIVMLTAKNDDMDKIMGLEYGADDYITKPFSVAEVLARVRANIRRVTQYAEPPEKSMVLTAGALRLDGKERTVTKAGERIELTAKEFDILKLLMANPKRVYTKAQLYTQVWNDAYCRDENLSLIHI